MKILITGGTGLLGKALIETCEIGGEIIATYIGDYVVEDNGLIKYRKLDVRDVEGNGKLFDEFRPEVVIHTASIGSPDFAEKNKKITWEINVGGVERILSLCEKYSSAFINISSNGIYDGGNAPYSEEDKAVPINYYGETKLQGEESTKKAKVPFAIVRPILMYGWGHAFERSNIVTKALAKLAKKERVFVYDDVYSNPLYAPHCAEVIWRIIKGNKYDLFNIAGKDRVSIFDLVRKAAEIFDLDVGLITPVQQGYFNELVPRPKDTSYETTKMEKVLKVKPLTLAEGLKMMRDTRK